MDKRFLLFFIDGLGIALGENPFLEQLLGRKLGPVDRPLLFKDMCLIPADAGLGVEGLPQSATGQTAIFTGINAAGELGYHLTAFPNRKLIALIKEHNIYTALKKKGLSAASANLYSPGYFERFKIYAVSTHALLLSRTEVRMSADYPANHGVYMDITNEIIHEHLPGIPVITPAEAGENILRLMAETHFVFYEYFLTDYFSHKLNRDKLEQCFDHLSEFLEKVLTCLDSGPYTVMLVSDHGNAEDLSTRAHTANPVPVAVWSRDRDYLLYCRDHIRSITDIKKSIEVYFSV